MYTHGALKELTLVSHLLGPRQVGPGHRCIQWMDERRRLWSGRQQEASQFSPKNLSKRGGGRSAKCYLKSQNSFYSKLQNTNNSKNESSYCSVVHSVVSVCACSVCMPYSIWPLSVTHLFLTFPHASFLLMYSGFLLISNIHIEKNTPNQLFEESNKQYMIEGWFLHVKVLLFHPYPLG